MALELVRGDTTSFPVEVRQTDGSLLDLAGTTLWFTVKPEVDADATDAAAVVKCYAVIDGTGAITSSAGISLGGKRPSDGVAAVTAADGTVTVTISATQSSGLPVGECPWDVQLKQGAIVQTIAGGVLAVLPDVTRRVTTP